MIDKCLLDMDGVLVNFVKGVCAFHGVDTPYPKYQNWNMEIPLGIDKNTFYGNLGREFWANLEWTPDGFEILEVVEERFGVKNVCLLTSPVAADGCIDGKMDWIKKHLPQYSRQFLVGPAKEFCANSNHFLVDDFEENIDKFNASGGRGVLVPRPWNTNRIHPDAVEFIRQCI